MPIVFVHGIAVRRDRFDRLLGTVRTMFDAAACPLPVTGCYWGDLGRAPGYRGTTIPGFLDGVRGTGGPVSAVLTVLLEDPLAELAGLRDADEYALEPLGFRPVPDAVVARNGLLGNARRPVAAGIAAAAGDFADPSRPVTPQEIADLVDAVIAEAARADRTLDAAELCGPMTRALTAGLWRIGDTGDLACGFRWNAAAATVQEALNRQLGGQRGLLADVGGHALTAALRHGVRNRIMPGLTLFLGDVLAWYRNRAAILDRVDRAVRAAGTDGPLVIVGHSLGGIISFEYCQESAREVRLLATVGSQVGLFGELGVLHAVERRLSVAAWRNLYDPDDALSFLARPMFTGVDDIQVDTRAPFPASHSEYWNLPSTYATILAAL